MVGKPSPKWRRSMWERFPVRPFVVVEESMRPGREPGDGIVAVRSRRCHAGEIRVFEHPLRPGFWLVKRVAHVLGERFVATSDNDVPGVVDSRRFGPVPVADSYRMLVRIPGSRLGRGRLTDAER